MMTPSVSILIPAYNAERWIGETMESAVNQTYPYVEVIVVNDGSTDRTSQLIHKYNSPRVKIIEQANAGGAAARNTALAHAQGDYIQWLDHDDLLAADKISEQIRRAQAVGDERILFSGAFGTFYYCPNRAKMVTGPLGTDLSPVDYFYIKFEQDE